MATTLQTIATRRPIKAAEILLSKYKNLTIYHAVWICQRLDCNMEEFLWQNKPTTIDSLNQSLLPPCSKIQEIKIKFYGGPIGFGTWHHGSIYTFILDHIANQILTIGYKAVKDKLV